MSDVVGGGGTDVTCCQAGTKICCARLDQACLPKKEDRYIFDLLSYQRYLPDPFLVLLPVYPLSFQFLTLFYLCDDSRPDLQGLNGGSLSDQRHRSLHSNRVTCWFGWIGGDSCWESEHQRFNEGEMLSVLQRKQITYTLNGCWT